MFMVVLPKHVETSVEQAKVLSDGSAKGIVSKKTVRTEWKRTGVLGPDFNEDD